MAFISIKEKLSRKLFEKINFHAGISCSKCYAMNLFSVGWLLIIARISTINLAGNFIIRLGRTHGKITKCLTLSNNLKKSINKLEEMV